MGFQCSGISQFFINLFFMVEMEYSKNLKLFQFFGYEVVVIDFVVYNNGYISISFMYLKIIKDKNFIILL